MKKTYLFLTLAFTAFAGLAQDIEKSTALKLVADQRAAVGLSAEDIANSIVSSAYYNQTSGTQLVYLQQSYKGLPVFNQVQTLAFKNGQLVSKAGVRITGIEGRTGKTNTTPTVSAENALKKVLAEKKLLNMHPLAAMRINGTEKLNFGKLGISHENVTTELMWVPIKDGKQVRLSWQVYITPTNSSDYWLINVDATDNKILEEINLTVYCNFDNKNHRHESEYATENKMPASLTSSLSPSIVNGASYRIIPFPAESPIHPGGTPALVTNPWTLAPGNATSLKWHSNGTTDYNISRGNNVWAREDRAGTDTSDNPFLPATSTTSPDPLTFNFIPDFTVAPTQATPVQNQQFNITNLFYWNNIIHDLVYQYGFDEVSGNFQANNQGRGGLANDFVNAQAQDGGGSNNANFSTPADGQSGRMQMYLWSGNPQRDGDVDNGVIVHEFGHGISNRLAGGPANAGCVSNAEQMGEGWSDYYALMATQDWASSILADGFNKPRGIGTYVSGQAITGPGIRTQRYCTNFAVNNRTYSASISAAVHTRGEIWCATLWDMTWNIINQVGSINPNLFNASGVGGNSIALKLVTEGLKLQRCNAGFLDGRDGILAADQILYNGTYRCAIITAFARRGMGFDASQGSANSVTDQVPGFSTAESSVSLTQNITQQMEGLNITYTNRVTAGLPGACNGITNYLLTDTLPSNVTYVSGGTYNAATRVVSFPINLAASQSQNYSFTVQINNGTWFPSTNLIDEQVTTTSIPAAWTTSGTNSFIVSSAQSHSAPNSFFGVNSTAISDFSLATTTPVALGPAPPTFTFWHNYNTEDGWDGGVAEISTNGGTTWSDLGTNMTENGYNGSMGTGSSNPLGGRSAFTGNSNGFIRTTISLLPFANQSALFRFRMASDNNTAEVGWYIDDIMLQSKAVVNMRSNLFNGAGIRVNVADTFTVILQNAACLSGAISTQPTDRVTCAGSDISFAVNANGTALSYQWQESSDAGISFNNISGATSSVLTLSNINASLNGTKYRVIINGTCTIALTSDTATLIVSEPIVLTTQPAPATGCVGSSLNFTVQTTGPSLTYQWQVSTGAAFENITNGTVYSGANTVTLSVTRITAAFNGNAYRVIVLGASCPALTSAVAVLTANPLPVAVINASAFVNITPAQPLTLTTTISPAGNYLYQWYRNNTILTGATEANYPVDVDKFGNYSVTVTNANGCSASTNLVTVADSASSQLFIYANPNNGRFQVRYFNATSNPQSRTLNVYDSKGARIYSKQFTISVAYDRMDVVLTNVQSGVYTVDLRDSNGKRIASGSVIIQ